MGAPSAGSLVRGGGASAGSLVRVRAAGLAEGEQPLADTPVLLQHLGDGSKNGRFELPRTQCEALASYEKIHLENTSTTYFTYLFVKSICFVVLARFRRRKVSFTFRVENRPWKFGHLIPSHCLLSIRSKSSLLLT